MAIVVTMPKLSPTMEEGVLLRWLKQVGETVSPGEVLAEVETDKANMEFPLEEEGTVLKLLVREGDTIKLGTPVAVLGEPGEDAEAALGGNASTPPAVPSSVPRKTERMQQKVEFVRPVAQEVARETSPQRGQGRLRSSPLARKLAAEQGLDLRTVTGSGPHGRIVLRDVEAALSSRPATAPLPPPAQPVLQMLPAATPDLRAAEVVPLTQMRKTVARRLTEAKQTVPHFYLSGEVECDDLWFFQHELRQAAEGPEQRVTLNDLIVKALALALVRVPAANASFGEAGLVRYRRVDIGVAVALEDGLITPVVRDADRKSIGAIAREIRELAERARQKKLKPEEYTGATFTVSNLGMYGVREFAAIINPPEAGILAVGEVAKRAVVVVEDDGDRIDIRRVVTLTLSCDHRVIDGALGARLFATLKQLMGKPLQLVL